MKINCSIFSLIIILTSSLYSCERKTGQRNIHIFSQNSQIYQRNKTTYDRESRSILKVENENGVKYVWIEINGIRLRFIFDTGASNICISVAEALVLYRQGTLRKEDILDIQYYQDATGKISPGTKINLRTVKIGKILLNNVEAVVIETSDAPLLLGQSALEKFGKISIDNKNNVIIFE